MTKAILELLEKNRMSVNTFLYIKAITFDLDNTLWDNTGIIESADKAMIEKLRRLVPKKIGDCETLPIQLIREKIAESEPGLVHRVSAMRKRVLTEWFITKGCEVEEANKLALIGFNEFYKERQKIKFFPGVEEILSNLSKLFPLGAITNGNADILSMPVGSFFKFSLTAEDFLAPKPEKDIFLFAIKKLNVSPQNILHVGDNFNDDILGASLLGMRTAWITKKQSNPQNNVIPDLTLKTVTDLPKYIRLSD